MAVKMCQKGDCKNVVPKGRRDWCSSECRENARRTSVAKRVTIKPSAEDLDLIALQKQLMKALRDRDDAIHKRADLAAAVYSAVNDCLDTLKFSPVPAPPKAKTHKTSEEVAVPLVSDLQLGKVTPTYNSQVAEERMERYANKIISLTEIQRSDHPVRNAHVLVLGDIIEGVIIFPGQQWLVDSSLYRQVTVDGPRIMVNFFRRMLATFDHVEVTWVIGNHGRLGKKGDYDPESNGDRMLGKIVEQLFEASGETRIHFNVPDGMGERHWYAIPEIGNWKVLCIHGDQIRGGFAGYPFYGLGKKV